MFRSGISRQLVTRMAWKLGWALVAVQEYERALRAFQYIEKVEL